MESRLRPYTTAGIALVGASVIALSPVAPPLPDVKVANPSVQLSAAVDPFTPWVDLLGQAETNLTGLADGWAEAPFPVLQQVIVNQLGYLSELPNFEAIAGQLLTNLQAGFEAPFAPDLVGSLDPAHVALFDLLPLLDVLPADLQPLIDFSASPLSGVLLGLVGPVIGPVLALAASVQSIVGNLTSEAPDPEAALNTLINVPAAMADAFLNGGQTLDLTPVLSAVGLELEALGFPLAVGITFGGLLSPGGSIFNALDLGLVIGGETSTLAAGVGPGAIGSLINLSKAIARAIGWDGTGNPLEADDAPPSPALPRSADDTSLLKASTTSITVTETSTGTGTGTGTEEVTSGDPAPEGAPAPEGSAESGTPAPVEQVNADETAAPVDQDNGDETVAKPVTKKPNPGAKIAGALKATGDNLRAAANDLGKRLTNGGKKTPKEQKAPAADKASPSEKSASE
ncbi:outer membrane porin GjpA [Mycolicibacterium baixiangningiae]|uniref:outer membrane porin GjpA n=1 Tax=Mycolicibacterium baixiangningiae TaxID=2761578 RepID=UPI0018665335|nr:outer membrane porin GjpA [Mycolicibacterium baixiangningiae]